jgi:hypothetical protein
LYRFDTIDVELKSTKCSPHPEWTQYTTGKEWTQAVAEEGTAATSSEATTMQRKKGRKKKGMLHPSLLAEIRQTLPAV